MESIESLNKRLIEYWGYGVGLEPNFRVVWADDQIETRFCTIEKFDNSGNWIGAETGFHELKKYSWIKGKYVLEQLQEVPLINRRELLNKTISHEPRWVFQDKFGNALPPKWEAIEIIIFSILKNKGPHHFAKYTEGDPVKERLESINAIEDDLFGNETNVTDALAHKQAIIVPRNYNDKSA